LAGASAEVTRKDGGLHIFGAFMPEPINLKKVFTSYRINYDPAALSRAERHSPWSYQIPCVNGTIWPYSDQLLAVDVDGHPHVARKLEQLDLDMLVNGEHEKTFLFPLEQAEQVLEIVKPRRRRRLSNEYKMQLTDRLRNAHRKGQNRP
jgi:hypothetical protein